MEKLQQNNTITNVLSSANKVFGFFSKNKKTLKIIFFTLFGALFIIGFSLYLFSGIGLTGSNLEGSGPFPSHNGVWYIKFDTEINGVTINNWDSLNQLINMQGMQNLSNFLSQALIFKDMNDATFIVWIVAISFLGFYLIVWLLYKFVFKRWMNKKLEQLFNEAGIDPTQIKDLSDITSMMG